MSNRLVSDLREMVSEQVQCRELLYQMTKRDLLLRYKQAIMGFAWAVFMPLLNTAIFSVVFTRVARIDVGMPYPLFAFTGLVAWNFFASSLRFSVVSLTSNTSLVTKVFFPREIFPLSSVLVCLVDTAVASLVLVMMMIGYGVVPGVWILALPLVIAAHLMLTMMFALLLAMGNLFFRDVKYLFDVGIQVWMFGTSVLYPATMVGGTAERAMRLNPLTPIVDAYRDVILLNRMPDPIGFSAVFAFSAIGLVFAWVVFHRAEYRFAESV